MTTTIVSKTQSKNAYYLLAALLPGLALTVYSAGLTRDATMVFYTNYSTLIKVAATIITALAVETIVRRIQRQAINPFHNPATLVMSLILALLLPPYLNWWQTAVIISFAIIAGYHILKNNPLAVLVGYVFALGFLPTEMGAAIFQRRELYNSYIIYVNAAFAVGGLFLIYKKIINWRIALAASLTYCGAAISTTMIYSGLPFSPIIINSALDHTTLLSTFFIAPFIIPTNQRNIIDVAAGIIVALVAFLLDRLGHYPNAFVLSLLSVNMIGLVISNRCHQPSHALITALSTHTLLVPLLAATLITAIAPSLASAALLGSIMMLVYLSSESMTDVLSRFLPKAAVTSSLIVLTLFLSVYICLIVSLYMPAMMLSLDNAAALIALSSLTLSFSATFNADTSAFTMGSGIKKSAACLIFILLTGALNQFVHLHNAVAGSLLLFACVALHNPRLLITTLTPAQTPDRRVRTTGDIR